jgi:cob(I)alamin adenosyltransferase
MVKIYTKTGDKGETSLVSGERLSKADNQIDLYGDVDELNSIIGIVNCYSSDDIKIHLSAIQNKLFDLGSNLACESSAREKYKLPQITQANVTDLEILIDNYSNDLPPLKNFILPGGHPSAAFLHQARTVCRRVERKLIGSKIEKPQNSVEYLNRLSDLFFVLSRAVNFSNKVEEVLWSPAK